jgi:hypothetical protein
LSFSNNIINSLYFPNIINQSTDYIINIIYSNDSKKKLFHSYYKVKNEFIYNNEMKLAKSKKRKKELMCYKLKQWKKRIINTLVFKLKRKIMELLFIYILINIKTII